MFRPLHTLGILAIIGSALGFSINSTTPTRVDAADSAITTTTEASTAPAVTCLGNVFIDVSTYANTGYAAPTLDVNCDGGTLTVTSNSIITYEFTRITPNDMAALTNTWRVTLSPSPAASETEISTTLGPIGFIVNGLPFYSPNEAPNAGYGDPYLDGILDFCNGHTDQRGQYHYHASPTCLFGNYTGNTNLIVGYAFDGYPIYAPYACADAACSQVVELQSSWQRTSDVRNAWEAHEYVAGSGDLDRCNGRTEADGSYRYYATATFPYLIGCYHGTPTANGGGGGQGQPPQGAPPQGGGNGGGQGQGPRPPRR